MAVGLLITVQVPSGTPLLVVMVGSVLAVSIWMLTTGRYELSLAVLMLYIGLADGFLKLKTGSSDATIARDVLLYSIAAGALARAAVRRERLDPPPLTGWVIAWVAVVAVQVLNPANGTLLHSLASVRPHVEWVPLFFLGYVAMRSKQRLRGFLLLLLLVAAVNGAVGLVQFNLTPDELADWGPGYEQKISGEGDVSGRAFVDEEGTARTRPFALGADQGFGGIVGLIAVPAALALLAAPRRPGVRVATALLSVGLILAIVTSQARVAVIGAIIAAFAFAALTVTSRTAIRALVAVGLTAVIAYGTVSVLTSDSESGAFDRYSSISSPGEAVATSYDYRRDTLARIPEYVVDFPLGAGIGSKGPAASFGGGANNQQRLNAESEPTYLLIELGVPGLLVLLAFNVKLFALTVRRVRRLADPELRLLLTAVAAPLFAFFATWVVGVSSATTPSSPYFWLAAGVLAYWLGDRRSRPDAPAVAGHPAYPVDRSNVAVRAAQRRLTQLRLDVRALGRRRESPDHEAEADDRRLSLTTATPEQLRDLGLTMTQTRRVLRYRAEHGGFSSVDELDELPGFPHRLLADVKTRLRP